MEKHPDVIAWSWRLCGLLALMKLKKEKSSRRTRLPKGSRAGLACSKPTGTPS